MAGHAVQTTRRRRSHATQRAAVMETGLESGGQLWPALQATKIIGFAPHQRLHITFT